MALKEDLQGAAAEIITRDRWTVRKGQVVPAPEDLELRNDAVNLDATVLYADIAESTQLVDNQSAHVAAEIYKAYMTCAARLIKNREGTITAYDGDRVMGMFIGESQQTNAAKAALNINWALIHVINPAIKKEYGQDAYQMSHAIGVDTSPIFAARIGIRNDNDIVWVGRAANYAAKLSSLNDRHPIFITKAVFDKLNETAKYGGDAKKLMWEARTWTGMNDMPVYSSNWTWSL